MFPSVKIATAEIVYLEKVAAAVIPLALNLLIAIWYGRPVDIVEPTETSTNDMTDNDFA